MKKIFSAFLLALIPVILLTAQGKELSELNKLKAENFKLKTQLTQCQITLSNGTLTKEQAELIESFRKELGAKNEEVFDWNSLSFKPAPISK